MRTIRYNDRIKVFVVAMLMCFFTYLVVHYLRQTCFHPRMAFERELNFKDSPGGDRVDVFPYSKHVHNGHINVNGMSEMEVRDIFLSFVDAIEIPCRRKYRFGDLDDGGWEVCAESRYAIEQDKCLIYSFGIKDDWTFDDAVADYYHCEIHSFDPSIQMKDHLRNKYIHYHNLGVGGLDEVNSDGWNMKTIKSIRTLLDHNNKMIDILKMDVEGSEFPTLTTSLKDGSLKGIRQLLVEFHAQTVEEMRKAIVILFELYKYGFRKFYTHKNNDKSNLVTYNSDIFPGTTSKCYEVYYLNTNL